MLKNIVYWRKQMLLHRSDLIKYHHCMFMAAYETKTWRLTNTLTAVKR